MVQDAKESGLTYLKPIRNGEVSAEKTKLRHEEDSDEAGETQSFNKIIRTAGHHYRRGHY